MSDTPKTPTAFKVEVPEDALNVGQGDNGPWCRVDAFIWIKPNAKHPKEFSFYVQRGEQPPAPGLYKFDPYSSIFVGKNSRLAVGSPRLERLPG